MDLVVQTVRIKHDSKVGYIASDTNIHRMENFQIKMIIKYFSEVSFLKIRLLKG